ncbi:Leucine-rich repeat domain, L domain-like,Leucine-rich repeat, typical subtype,Leucine rich [Cinara cedri]|uniref:Leucine-rich repeat domain, L domain-like,Leucine-rich repeat, typical subtype,Leucine rich n=1 Tax=Cinara cedri TaxID=506608 RepID=A0A5E4NDQ0_9HEMI|nr:Leucine-rich repeat domain, L domain-like,Leucine-rich repeat, typical subtype,Leucine rich [Cinara cedri]
MLLTWSHKLRYRRQRVQQSTTTAKTLARVFRKRQMNGVQVLMAFVLITADSMRSWTCPDACICLTPKKILCNSGHLTFVPLGNLPKTVEHLSMTKNNLTYLPSDAFSGLRCLRKLTLDGNSIESVERFAFRGLPRLRELSIQNTPLTSLQKFSFASLQNVTAILLGYNKISVIDEFAFAGTANIRLLLLNNNPLHTVSANAFSGLTNVEHIIMPSGIRDLQPDAFNGLDSVGLLRLAFMDLSSLRPYTFRGLSHVHVLAVQDSDLGVIRADAFSGLTHVGSLNLLNNKIDSIQSLAVTDDNRVKHFRFNGNHVLESPKRGSFALVTINDSTVISNHFPCDCHLFRFVDGRPFGNLSYESFTGKNYCISPLELNGQSVSVVKRSFVDKCLQSSLAATLVAAPPSRTFLITVAMFLFVFVR